MKYKWKRDCRSFAGIYACDVLKSENYKSCEECRFYDPISKKILIIKLGAMGDVLRTTPLLPAIKKKYGEGISITWLVNEESVDLLKGNYQIDRILVYNAENIMRLREEDFDVLFSLEVGFPGVFLANKINAKEKYGFYLAKDGHPTTFNKASDYYLERVFSDYMNKNNKKTYQEMMFEICELDYFKQDYILNFFRAQQEYQKQFIRKFGLKGKNLGINIGSADRWKSKMWNKERIMKFIKEVLDSTDYNVIVLGGPRESLLQKEIVGVFKNERRVAFNDTQNSIKEFISVVDLCDPVVVGDSLALHIAAALKKKVIALFFCTPPSEVEDYGRIYKITSKLLDKYLYYEDYDEELVNSISIDDVFSLLKKIK